jgi:hypothetical protein
MRNVTRGGRHECRAILGSQSSDLRSLSATGWYGKLLRVQYMPEQSA